MTLNELKQIHDSLSECDPDVENFNWGPTLEFANLRKEAALQLLNREIQKLQNIKD